MYWATGLGTISIKTHLLTKCIRNILVVFSIDLINTLDLGVMGEFASFNGLKLRTAFMILFEVPGLVLTNTDKEFNVASIRMASLIITQTVRPGLVFKI